MGPEGSLLCSQEPVTGPYPEQDEFPPYFHKIRFYVVFLSMSRSCKWSLPFRFSD